MIECFNQSTNPWNLPSKSQPLSFSDKPLILLLWMIVPLTAFLTRLVLIIQITAHWDPKRCNNLPKVPQLMSSKDTSSINDLSVFAFLVRKLPCYIYNFFPSFSKVGTELRPPSGRQEGVHQVPVPFRFSFFLRSLNNSCCHSHGGLRRVSLPWRRLKWKEQNKTKIFLLPMV